MNGADAQSPLAGRRVVVAGGTGFVGTHFIQALLTAGAQVRAVRHQRPPLVDDPRIQWVEADLMERTHCLKAVEGMDWVIQAAGSVGSSATDPARALAGMTDTLTLTGNLLWAAWNAGCARALVFSSSTGYPAGDHAMSEAEFWDGPVHPSYDGYGWMRRYVERLAEFTAARSGLHVGIVRPGAIYGRHDNFDPAGSHVIASLLRRAVERENPFVVWGSGNETRDILHVDDFVAGSLLVLAQGRSAEAVNVAAGHATTIGDLARSVLEACGHDASLRFDPTKPTAIPHRRLDIAKALALGFAPRVSLAEGLADTARWLREVRP